MTRRAFRACCVLPFAMSVGASHISAQAPSRDTVFLDALQHAAETTDRRAEQIELLNGQLALRLQTIRNERRPSFNAAASAQYFSDVASISSVLGNTIAINGRSIPTPAHDQYDASITARQPLYDATRSKRAAVENALTNESVARLRAALWQQRQLVNDAFFAVQLFETQQKSIDASVVDLTARRTAAQQRVAAGSALPSEVLLIDAELLRRMQTRSELQAQRDAAREVLAALTGSDIPTAATLAVRSDSPALPAPDYAATQRSRPEYLTFERTRETVNARLAELSARD